MIDQAPPAKVAPSPIWEEIAAFYAGRPVSIEFADNIGGYGRTLSGSSRIQLSPEVRDSLRDFFKNKQARFKRGPVGVLGLATLIHEAIHNRDFTRGPDGRPIPGFWPSDGPGPTGFMSASDERQANALGSELVPDLLQRFFGVKINSPLSRKYAKAARSLSSYLGAYAGKT